MSFSGSSSNSQQSSSSSPKRLFFWTFIGALILLLVAAAVGVLGPSLILIAVLLFVVGLVAVIRGNFPMFGISSRRNATGVLLLGVYFVILGTVTSTTTEGEAPVAVAAGDTCEITGTTVEQDDAVFYCVPSESGDLVWGTETDFTAYQQTERQKLEDEAEQEAQTLVEQRDEEVAAAEKRADDAESELQEYKDEVMAEQEEREAEEAREAEKAEEEAAAEAEAEAERQRQEEEATQDTPAPAAPAQPQDNTDSGSSSYYENCTAAREAGAAPVHRGDPGYGPHLDRDGDGIGCE